eukprot:TRINITY_DN40728_c0_g1_i3.p1 TRINITY_DN40728_c0_g1~~TRINITY_DN40728_c0_g1_i3.p1  ORF type:complete len:103 (-),score=31.00 TRINITY_DN40728_c0_g1_i3:141-449(-)
MCIRDRIRVVNGSRTLMSTYKQVFRMSVVLDAGLSDCRADGWNHLIVDGQHPDCAVHEATAERHLFRLKKIGASYGVLEEHRILEHHGVKRPAPNPGHLDEL